MIGLSIIFTESYSTLNSPRNDDRVVHLLFGKTRLAKDYQRRTGLRLPQCFHRGQSDRLFSRDHPPRPIASWEELQDADNKSGDDSQTNEDAALLHVFLA